MLGECIHGALEENGFYQDGISSALCSESSLCFKQAPDYFLIMDTCFLALEYSSKFSLICHHVGFYLAHTRKKFEFLL